MPLTVTLKPPTGFKYGNEMELVEEGTKPPSDKLSLELYDFLQPEESYVVGDVMRERGRAEGNLAGQLYAERLLEHQNQIPAEWREFYLVFAETVRLDPDGSLVVPCLCWRGDGWHLSWYYLEDDFRSGCRLVLRRN